MAPEKTLRDTNNLECCYHPLRLKDIIRIFAPIICIPISLYFAFVNVLLGMVFLSLLCLIEAITQ